MKIYFKILDLLGFYLLQVPLYNKYRNVELYVCDYAHIMLVKADLYEFDYYLKKIKSFKLRESFYKTVFTKQKIEVYCKKHNVVYDDIYQKIYGDISFGSENIYRLIDKSYHIFGNVVDFLCKIEFFNIYYTHKYNITNIIDCCDKIFAGCHPGISNMKQIKFYLRNDKTGLVINELNNHISKYHIQINSNKYKNIKTIIDNEISRRWCGSFYDEYVNK